MKTFPTIALLLALAAPVAAQDPLANEVCAMQGALAESIMAARQAGVDLGVMLDIATGPLGEAARLMVLASFEMPRFENAAVRASAIARFGEIFELACHREFAR